MIVAAVIFTCCSVYVVFGTFCVKAWEHSIDTPLITDQLPHVWPVWLMKFLYSVNLIFSFPLVIYPANIIFESYLFPNMPKTKKRQMYKNISRTLLVLFVIGFTIYVGDKTSSFLAILGSVSCTPVAFTFPAMFHYKLLAKTWTQKSIDILIFIVSLGLGIWCTVLGVINF